MNKSATYSLENTVFPPVRDDIVTFWSKETATLSTEEVLGVPCPVQRRHHFLETQTHRVTSLRLVGPVKGSSE